MSANKALFEARINWFCALFLGWFNLANKAFICNRGSDPFLFAFPSLN
jgi:hypothetical protein